MGRVCSTNVRNSHMDIVGKPEGKSSIERTRLKWMILRVILEKQEALLWTGLFWLTIRTSEVVL
jgi:hypothetical protein